MNEYHPMDETLVVVPILLSAMTEAITSAGLDIH